MAILSVDTELNAFSITRIEAKEPRCIALFAVGRGGNPAPLAYFAGNRRQGLHDHCTSFRHAGINGTHQG